MSACHHPNKGKWKLKGYHIDVMLAIPIPIVLGVLSQHRPDCRHCFRCFLFFSCSQRWFWSKFLSLDDLPHRSNMKSHRVVGTRYVCSTIFAENVDSFQGLPWGKLLILVLHSVGGRIIPAATTIGSQTENKGRPIFF
jgi:hypothetical protein